MCALGFIGFTLRVHVPNNWVLGLGVVINIIQVMGKYMIVRYLDPYPIRLQITQNRYYV